MAARAPLIITGGHFVDLSSRRRTESELALSSSSIKSHYGELPDGKLAGWHARYYRHLMGIMIVSLVHKHDITAIATLGEQGYDQHPDHIATHRAALGAQAIMQSNGLDIPLLALNADHTGEVQVHVETPRKLSSLALHASSFPLEPDGAISPEFWQKHPIYLPLRERETYDVS